MRKIVHFSEINNCSVLQNCGFLFLFIYLLVYVHVYSHVHAWHMCGRLEDNYQRTEGGIQETVLSFCSGSWDSDSGISLCSKYLLSVDPNYWV